MAIVLEPEQVTDYMAEIRGNNRFVSIANEIYIIKHPSEGIMNEGRLVYTQSLMACINAGVPTKAVMRTQLIEAIKASGKDPEILTKRQGLMQRMADTLKDTIPQQTVAGAATSLPDFAIAIENAFSKVSMEDRELMQQAADIEELEIGMMSNCAEALAATHRDLFLLHRCTFKSDGSPVWDSYETLQDEQDLALIGDLADEFQRFVTGLPMVYEVVLPTPAEVPEGFPTQQPS